LVFIGDVRKLSVHGAASNGRVTDRWRHATLWRRERWKCSCD